MVNNVYLVNIPEEEHEKIKELAKEALYKINGVSEEINFILVGEKESKMQLRLNCGKSATFMSIVDNSIAEKYYNVLENVFNLKSVYIYKGFVDFKRQIHCDFGLSCVEETVNTEITTEEYFSEEQVEELYEVEEIQEEPFIVPDIDTIETDNVYYESEITNLAKDKEELENNLKQELEDKQELNSKIDEYTSKIGSLSDECTILTNMLTDSRDLVTTLERELETTKGRAETSEGEVVQLTQELESLKSNTRVLELELESKKNRVEELNRDIEEHKKTIELHENTILELREQLGNSNSNGNEELDVQMQETIDELIAARNECNITKKMLTERDRNYFELSKQMDKINKSIFTNLGKKATLKSMITDTVTKFKPVSKFTLIASGNCDSMHETAEYIRRTAENTTERLVVVDLTYETSLDFNLGIGQSRVELNDLLVGNTSEVEHCLIRTKYTNCRYARLAMNFINEGYYLTMDWEKLLTGLEKLDCNVIIHLGNLSGVYKGVVFNTLCRYMTTQIVTKITSINIRTMLLTLSSFKDVSNYISCVGVKPKTGNIPEIFNKLSEKYTARIIDERDIITL